MKPASSAKKEVSLIVPLFNNEKTLVSQLKQSERILEKLCKHYEIIVCDDKSTDKSAQILRKYFADNPKVTLLFHSTNQGIAKTIYSLYKKARFTYVTLYSVDGDWDPNDIGKLLSCAFETNADIVIGRRSIDDYTAYRKMLSILYNFLPNLLFQVKTIDAGSIKVLKKDLIRSNPIISKSVFFEAELIIRAAKKNKKIVSTPVYFKRPKKKKSMGGKINLAVLSLIDIINLRFRL